VEEAANIKLCGIRKLFIDSIETKKQLLDGDCLDVLARMGDSIAKATKQGGKLMLCGNGGSAADAQHLAAEMLVRLRPNNNREGIAALALCQDTSTITACGNDFGYNKLYERMVKSLGKEGDILLAITTSGNSENIILALKAARELGVKAFGFLGAGGGSALSLCDEAFLVPSNDTGRIQESHITAGHALMEYVEDRLLEDGFITLED
jgi:D-sedoheptulose 7-phosphate isomerase